MKRLLMVALLAASCAAGAAETNAVEWSDCAATNSPWNIRRFEREMCGGDPWEPFNRPMFWIFDVGMEYVVDPFCCLYSSIIPKPLITGINNFSEHVEYPGRLISNLLMGEWTLALDSTERFLINTTLGVGGIFDPAKHWFGIYDDEATLSDTFARWGIPAGPQLALPFMPRASVRGHVGYVLDYAFDGKTIFDIFVPSGILLGYSWSLTPNKAPVWMPNWASMMYHNEDTYSVYMPAMSGLTDFNLHQEVAHYVHDIRVGNPVEELRPPLQASPTRPEWVNGEWREIPGYRPRGEAIDSLRALCFTPQGDDSFWWERHSIFNRDFSKSIEERKLVIEEGLPEATYSFIAPRDDTEGHESRPEHVVVVIPGLGSGRTASDAVSMAELLNNDGYGVVICDSIFTYEYMRSVNRGILPGYIPEDIRRLGDYLARIFADLKEAELVRDPDVSVIGWSMGGLVTLHLSALDWRDELPIRVNRFVAINPPTLLADGDMNPIKPDIVDGGEWSKEEAISNAVQIARGMYVWALMNHPRFDPDDPPKNYFGEPWEYTPNITESQARYLLCLTLRNTFVPLVAERQFHQPFPWIRSELTWANRSDFYDEIGDLLITEYLGRYLPTCYEGVTRSDVLQAAGVRYMGDNLVNNHKLSVIHSWTDLLLNEGDREFYDEKLGKRITWFADGAHCGYFYTVPFRDELLRRLEAR